LRIGHGYDVHRLVEGRPLLLGGYAVPCERGPEGHSDADVLAHAVGDALLGAAGEGDLGLHFPPSDPGFAGISGRELLRRVLERVKRRGLRIGNVDATVIAEAPRLGPHQRAIRESLAGLLGVAPDRVNLKVKSAERLGALGRGEGIAAEAVVLLERAGSEP
jgi:2-C-methyl-D-erythritol 2,4-cyclodiphosphate synthase